MAPSSDFPLDTASSLYHPFPVKRSHLPLLVLVLIMIGFRYLGAKFPEVLPNFNPLPALLLCSLVFLKGAQRWALPLSIWILTDPVASLAQGSTVFGWHHLSIAAGLASVVIIALALKGRGLGTLFLGTAVSALSFYFLTNCFSFLTLPIYPKTLEGFIQAQWTGPVGLGPTWIFLRNLLAANLLFTSLFVLSMRAPFALPEPKTVNA